MTLLFAFLFPMIAGPAAALLPLQNEKLRRWLYALTALITDGLCILAMTGNSGVTLFAFTETVHLSFSLDPLGKAVLAVVLLLYTAVCFYSFEYMETEDEPRRFFAFYFVTMGAMISLCMAQNLVTMYLCFEFVTLTSLPLVLHEMTREAVAAGLKYLFYSIGGALLGLFAIFFIYHYSGSSTDFVYGGFLESGRIAGHETVFLIAVFCGILGFGTKAGMYPMHGWLPTAHPVAPAPASALLSGIIAKAGILAVIRMVYFAVGPEILSGTWVQYTWMILAMITIFMGSMMAYQEKVTKKRLAYSTVSQLSYIMLGLSLLSAGGLKGGLLHLMSHAVSKGCLFMVAGIFICKLGKRRVTELKGVGKQMPVTMWCFMIAALSLVGIPPMGGFLSKWVIAGSAIESGAGVLSILGPALLMVSALLTAGYLFPIAIDAFFPGHDFDMSQAPKREPSARMLVPLLVLCTAALIVGVFGMQIMAWLPL